VSTEAQEPEPGRPYRRFRIPGGLEISKPPQIYETTVAVAIEREFVPVSVVTVPARLLSSEELHELGHPGGLADLLSGADPHIESVVEIGTEDALRRVLALMMWRSVSGRDFMAEGDPNEPEGFPIPAELLIAADILMYRAAIPAEASDMAAHTLAKLFGTGTGTVAVAAVLTGVAPPIVLAAIPAGIVILIVQAAGEGVAEGLKEGIKAKIIKKLKPKD
jgi:hypothetical protein